MSVLLVSLLHRNNFFPMTGSSPIGASPTTPSPFHQAAESPQAPSPSGTGQEKNIVSQLRFSEDDGGSGLFSQSHGRLYSHFLSLSFSCYRRLQSHFKAHIVLSQQNFGILKIQITTFHHIILKNLVSTKEHRSEPIHIIIFQCYYYIIISLQRQQSQKPLSQKCQEWFCNEVLLYFDKQSFVQILKMLFT